MYTDECRPPANSQSSPAIILDTDNDLHKPAECTAKEKEGAAGLCLLLNSSQNVINQIYLPEVQDTSEASIIIPARMESDTSPPDPT